MAKYHEELNFQSYGNCLCWREGLDCRIQLLSSRGMARPLLSGSGDQPQQNIIGDLKWYGQTAAVLA
eukprot:scaffold223436_cov18-Tisochrysis_lutea.AAC.1